jgi:branched-chain amino acid transport system permease protein
VPEFWITQANYIGLYTWSALGLVLLTGVAGLTSFGQAAFRRPRRLHRGLPCR